jgi:high-affinity Fe2+/Pb2+ permease
LLKRRQRAFLWGTVVGLAVAVVIGLLLPVGDIKADRTEITPRSSRH